MHDRKPITVEWSLAPEAIRDLAAGRSGRVVAITGPVGAGKSTLAARLSSCIVSTDSYLPDYDRVPYERRDDPELADLARLAADLHALASGNPAMIPVWSFHTHRREGERPIPAPAPGELVVCEGLHALHSPAADAAHLRVYVDAPAGVRWARWEILETTGVRGWGPAVAKEFFDAVAEPTFRRWSTALRASADVVVSNPIGTPT